MQQQNAVEEAALNSTVRERDQQHRQAKRASEQAQETEQDLLQQLQQAAPQSAEHFRTIQAGSHAMCLEESPVQINPVVEAKASKAAMYPEYLMA